MRALIVVAVLLVAGLLVYLLVADGRRGAGDREGTGTRAKTERKGLDDSNASPSLIVGKGGPAAGAFPDPVDFNAIDARRDLHGIVEDAEGNPVAGAKLEAVRYPFRRLSSVAIDHWQESVVASRTRSARDGTFALRLARGTMYGLRVEAEGFAPYERPYPAGSFVRVVLRVGVTLAVVAVDEGDKPVAGVRLRLFQRRRETKQTLHRTGGTDADGRFVFQNLPAGMKVYLEPLHDTLAPPGWGWVPVDLTTSGATEKRLVMSTGRTITGRVTDAETGAGINGAKVGVGWTQRRFVLTDGEGRYVLSGWKDGNSGSALEVTAAGYGRTRRGRIGKAETVDFTLRRGFELRGVVLSPERGPVAGARVGAVGSKRPRRGEQRLSFGHSVTGADGRFVVPSLRTDLAHTLVIAADGYGRTAIEVVAKDDAVLDIGEIVLVGGLRLEGTLQDRAGRPEPDVEITLRGPGQIKQFTPGRRETARTDQGGRFSFADLAAGAYRLSVRRRSAPDVQKDVVLGDRDLVDLQLVAATTQPFAVRVEGDSGTFLVGVTVMVLAGSARMSAETAKDGRATFQVPGQVNSVEAYPGNGYLPPEKLTNIAAGTAEVRLRAKKGTQLAGKVVKADGTPLAQAWLKITRGEKQVATARAKADGTFEVTVPNAGALDIKLAGVVRTIGSGYTIDTNPPYTGELKGVSPGTTDLVLTVRKVTKGQALVVTVLTPDGKPVAKAAVLVHGTRTAETTGPDGRAELFDLPNRELKIAVRVPRSMPFVFDGPVTVAAGAGRVTVRLVRGVPIRGVVVKPDGHRVANARIYAFSKNSILRSAATGADGRFEILVPPGAAGVRLQASEPVANGMLGSATAAAGDTDVRIELKPR